MKVTTFEGIIKNGQIQLPLDVHLPEKAKVYVVIPDVEIKQAAYIGSPKLVHKEQISDFKKEIFEEQSDVNL
jgi:hypothetical protein